MEVYGSVSEIVRNAIDTYLANEYIQAMKRKEIEKIVNMIYEKNVKDKYGSSSIIFVEKDNVKETWLDLLIKTILLGDEIKTEYDRKNDFESLDTTATIRINKPFSDPCKRNNKDLNLKTKYGNYYNIYGHISDLILPMSIKGGYIEEILFGENDKNVKNPDVSPSYTYHDRLRKYVPYSNEDIKESPRPDVSIISESGKSAPLPFEPYDQINFIISKLKKASYTRRAQGITWRPYSDPNRPDPPCLQRIWCRVKNKRLDMQTTWRSRDLFKAWQTNVNGMIQIQKFIASKLLINTGTYTEFVNSLHIYGKDFNMLKATLETIISRDDAKEDTITQLKLAVEKIKKLKEEHENGYK